MASGGFDSAVGTTDLASAVTTTIASQSLEGRCKGTPPFTPTGSLRAESSQQPAGGVAGAGRIARRRLPPITSCAPPCAIFRTPPLRVRGTSGNGHGSHRRRGAGPFKCRPKTVDFVLSEPRVRGSSASRRPAGVFIRPLCPLADNSMAARRACRGERIRLNWCLRVPQVLTGEIVHAAPPRSFSRS
jgi:hypothetical protein